MRASFFIVLFTLLCAQLYPAVPVIIDGAPLVSYADAKLSNCGAMEKTSDGFVYLKVSDRYIDDLFPLLQSSLPADQAAALCKPPYMDKGMVGAHVSVIYIGELAKKITSFPEDGRKECFTISSLAYVDPEKGPFQRVYYLRVLSDGLKKIRQNYSLSPLFQGHDFHISIGVIYRDQG